VQVPVALTYRTVWANRIAPSPRVPFIASADVIDTETVVRLSARTGDLSRNGRYMDMVNPLPLGTTVQVEIAHGQRIFSATAGVVYSQTPLGMGVEFRSVEASEQDTLERNG
jgi:hypothetical protein